MTGDAPDFARRLRQLLPDRWFPDDAPVLSMVLQAFGAGWASLYAMLAAVKTQTRLLTVSGSFLDLAVRDYRGTDLPRRLNETDQAYRARFLPVFRDQVTRAAVVARMTELGCTGITVFEPARPADVGAYRTTGGYGVAGRYGSLLMPMQSLIRAQRPDYAAVPPGADAAPAGDYDIYAAVARILPAGGIAWMSLAGPALGGPVYSDGRTVPGGAPLGTFLLGTNTLAP